MLPVIVTSNGLAAQIVEGWENAAAPRVVAVHGRETNGGVRPSLEAREHPRTVARVMPVAS